MRTKLPTSKPSSAGSEQSPREIVLATVADTTWRVFAPVAICVSLTIWLDITFDTKPWLTVIGLIVGLVLAALLVRKQIKEL